MIPFVRVTSCRFPRFTSAYLFTCLLLLPLSRAECDDVASPTAGSDSSGLVEETRAPAFRTEVARGKVIWLAEALADRFGISTVPEAADRILALQSDDGAVLPILEDVRGRAFRRDERLRGPQLELLVRRYAHHPMLQVLQVYELKDGKKYELDYWCDVCGIVMFETGPCACCQDDNRLRKRLQPDSSPAEVSAPAVDQSVPNKPQR